MVRRCINNKRKFVFCLFFKKDLLYFMLSCAINNINKYNNNLGGHKRKKHVIKTKELKKITDGKKRV
jgi:hypothetical protein